jgi:hypothetical protein
VSGMKEFHQNDHLSLKYFALTKFPLQSIQISIPKDHSQLNRVKVKVKEVVQSFVSSILEVLLDTLQEFHHSK